MKERKKGWHLSEETKAKLSKSHKGISWGHHTKETKKKISLSHKGNMKGKDGRISVNI